MNTDEFENAMNEGRIERKHCKWMLAEVKRLREALSGIQRSLIWDEKDREMDGDPVTLEALVEQVEQVRSDITEMIE